MEYINGAQIPHAEFRITSIDAPPQRMGSITAHSLGVGCA